MTGADISVIVPAYNRAPLLSYSLESVRRAKGSLSVEVIVVDDGSNPPVEPTLPAIAGVQGRVIRQKNRGLLFARLRGLAECTGRYVLFLDSDDLIGTEKLRSQITSMDAMDVDVTYTRWAHCVLDREFQSLIVQHDAVPSATTDPAELFITLQPPPHSPIWRTDYLRRIVSRAPFPPAEYYNCIAEIWFYYIAAASPARVFFVAEGEAIIGIHPGARLTDHWEKLGIASLALLERFAASCPCETTEQRRARSLAGLKAWKAWRALPRGIQSRFEQRLLAVARGLGAGEHAKDMGGTWFQLCARVFGAEHAARVFRRLRGARYELHRTISDDEFMQQLNSVPYLQDVAAPSRPFTGHWRRPRR